jgi:hypothetical protein
VADAKPWVSISLKKHNTAVFAISDVSQYLSRAFIRLLHLLMNSGVHNPTKYKDYHTWLSQSRVPYLNIYTFPWVYGVGTWTIYLCKIFLIYSMCTWYKISYQKYCFNFGYSCHTCVLWIDGWTPHGWLVTSLMARRSELSSSLALFCQFLPYMQMCSHPLIMGQCTMDGTSELYNHRYCSVY